MGENPLPNTTTTEAKPVAWRVKDYADGWVLYHSEERARRAAEQSDALLEPLYASPLPTVPEDIAGLVEIAHTRAARPEVCSTDSWLLLSLGQSLEALHQKNKELEEERDRLRMALVKAGNNAGGHLSLDVSTDFLMHVPEEVHLVVERLRTELKVEAGAHAAKIRRAEKAETALTASQAECERLRKALEEIRDRTALGLQARRIARAALSSKAGESE